MIPETALSITLDTAHLTLNDLELFEPGGFTIRGFKAFMVEHSNWSADEVGRLEVSELEGVFVTLSDKLKESAIPKANGAHSANGQAGKARPRPGRRVSPTPSGSA